MAPVSQGKAAYGDITYAARSPVRTDQSNAVNSENILLLLNAAVGFSIRKQAELNKSGKFPGKLSGVSMDNSLLCHEPIQ